MRDCLWAFDMDGSALLGVGCSGCGAIGVIGVSRVTFEVDVAVPLTPAFAPLPLALGLFKPFSSSARSSSDIIVVATEVISFIREISPI